MSATYNKITNEKIRNYIKESINTFFEEKDFSFIPNGEIKNHPLKCYWMVCNKEKFYTHYKNNFEQFKDWNQGLGGFGADIYYSLSEKDNQLLCQDILQDWIDGYRIHENNLEDSDLMCRLVFREFSKMLRKESEVYI